MSPRELNTEKTFPGWLPSKSSHRIEAALTGMPTLSLWVWVQFEQPFRDSVMQIIRSSVTGSPFPHH